MGQWHRLKCIHLTRLSAISRLKYEKFIDRKYYRMRSSKAAIPHRQGIKGIEHIWRQFDDWCEGRRNGVDEEFRAKKLSQAQEEIIAERRKQKELKKANKTVVPTETSKKGKEEESEDNEEYGNEIAEVSSGDERYEVDMNREFNDLIQYNNDIGNRTEGSVSQETQPVNFEQTRPIMMLME